MRLRIVGDVGAIQTNGLAVEEIAQGFIGGAGVAQRTGGHPDASDEVLIQLTFQTEAHADAGAIAVGNTSLKEVLTPDAHVASEADASERALQPG